MTPAEENAAWERHELEQRRWEASWPLSEKLLWLEEAETLVLQMRALDPEFGVAAPLLRNGS